MTAGGDMVPDERTVTVGVGGAPPVPHYADHGVLERSPFASIDEEGAVLAAQPQLEAVARGFTAIRTTAPTSIRCFGSAGWST